MDDLADLLAAERADAEARIEALTRNYDDVVASIEDVGNDDEHDPDGSTIAFERAQVIALLDAARDRLRALDEAADRLAAGEHGTCESCGQPIPLERLQARPTTRTCVGCAGRAAGR